MNLFIKIVLWALALFFVYSIISVSYEQCSQTSTDLKEQAKNGVENVSGMASDAADDLNDEFFSDDEQEAYREDDNSLADDLFDDSEASYEKDVEPAVTYSDPTPTPSPKPTPSYSNSGGKYMVIAGNFLVQGNAGNMVDKLRNLGYDAESVVFDGSQYYTVLANRTDDYNNALSVSSRLKSEGVDNYVKTQQF